MQYRLPRRDYTEFFSRFAMLRPVIDTAKCKNCKQCEHQCKASCINIDTHKIDYSRCVDCFNCIDTCKFGALKYRFAWDGDASAAPQQDNGKPKHDNVTLSEANGSSGRRAFLAGTALAIGTAALKAQEKKVDGGLAAVLDKEIPRRKTPITPPGSVSSKNMYNHCTACQLCVAKCPNNVLRPSGSLEHFMQPESSYERGCCRPECTRCSEICPTGAIRRITREEKTAIHIGTATIQRDLCVAEEGVSCGNCARHCPSGAIRMVTMEDRGITVPTVDKEICIGCGKCRTLGRCVFDNDVVDEVVVKFKEADGIVLGSPVYFGAVSGTMASFLNRLFYCLPR